MVGEKDQETRRSFEKLVADALARVNEESLREIVAQVIRERLGDWHWGDVITEAFRPVVRQMAAEMVREPAVLEALQARVKSQLLGLAGNVNIEAPRLR